VIYFFPDSPTEVIRRRIFTHKGSNYVQSRKEVPFWGPNDGRPHLEGQIPQKPSKIAFYKHVRASVNGLKTNDVIEDWRHWLAVARGRAAYTIYSIVEITVFYNIYNATIADALYSVRKFSFC